MRLIQIAVSDFAVPVPRCGSIEAHSGFGRATEAGIEIHNHVQERRAEQSSSYRSEVKSSREFERGDLKFKVGGRIDGLYETDPPKIEEIKASFNVHELRLKLSEGAVTHPYCLQLRTYGYFHWLEHQVAPKLSFHLVSIRTGETSDLDLDLDIAGYEKWLGRRLDELARETKTREKQGKQRKKWAERFAFPFEKPRTGQLELIETVQNAALEKSRLLVQAPTGRGKTAESCIPRSKKRSAEVSPPSM